MTATRIPQLSINALDNIFAGGSSAFSCGIRLGTNLQAQLDDKPSVSSAGVAGGLATLDMTGKLPATQLSVTVVEYKGSWSATTNIPALADGTGNTGDMYVVSAPGTVNFGSGPIVFFAGDWAIYSGTVWERISGYAPVYSVNSKAGAVVLNTDDIAEPLTPTNRWFTEARAKASISSSATGLSYDSGTGVFSLTASYEIPTTTQLGSYALAGKSIQVAKAHFVFSDLASGTYHFAGDTIPANAMLVDGIASVTVGFNDSLSTNLGLIEVQVNGVAADMFTSAPIVGSPMAIIGGQNPTAAGAAGSAWGQRILSTGAHQMGLKWTQNAAETLVAGVVDIYTMYILL